MVQAHRAAFQSTLHLQAFIWRQKRVGMKFFGRGRTEGSRNSIPFSEFMIILLLLVLLHCRLFICGTDSHSLNNILLDMLVERTAHEKTGNMLRVWCMRVWGRAIFFNKIRIFHTKRTSLHTQTSTYTYTQQNTITISTTEPSKIVHTRMWILFYLPDAIPIQTLFSFQVQTISGHSASSPFFLFGNWKKKYLTVVPFFSYFCSRSWEICLWFYETVLSLIKFTRKSISFFFQAVGK